jgi:hypothetical protein
LCSSGWAAADNSKGRTLPGLNFYEPFFLSTSFNAASGVLPVVVPECVERAGSRSA